MGSSALSALSQLQPKESIRFLWLGEFVIAEVIELFHRNGIWYMTLCPLTLEYQNKLGLFTVPIDNQGHIPKLDCLAIIQSPQKQNNKIVASYYNYIDFMVGNIRHISFDSLYTFHILISPDYFADIADDFESIVNSLSQKIGYILSDYELLEESNEILFTKVSFEKMGIVMKAIRSFIRDHRIFGFQLYLE